MMAPHPISCHTPDHTYRCLKYFGSPRKYTLSIPSAIFSEADLSYIGLGIPLPMCSWGSLAQLGIENFRIYPSQLMIPAICISLTMLAFNMFGDGLRDAFDPKLRR